ncbi:MAG: DUF2066 domain-containing protein, partial [Gammaproteobacteria bacterium]|nr:DUF2066 domain-containing protein [Gammaproteobacteria bacterium]
YETEIGIATQSSDERENALTAAMRQILLRISGRSIVLTVTGIEEALSQPTQYVQQYRYRAKNRDVTVPNADAEQVLWVRFDENAINQLLRDNRIPVWSKTRPSVLLWMVVDDRKERLLIGNNIAHITSDLIREQAHLRGIPLRFPLLDLADQASLTVADVWGNFEDTILRASQRYQTEAVLVGRVYQTYSDSWNVRWTLYNNSRREDWEAHAESLIEVLIPGIDNTANSLAQQFTQSTIEESDSFVLVQILGVNNLASYNKATSYLASLTAVSDLQPYKVSRDNVIYKLHTRRGRLAISQAISLGHTLVMSDATGAPKMTVRGNNELRPENQISDEETKQITADLIYQLIQ